MTLEQAIWNAAYAISAANPKAVLMAVSDFPYSSLAAELYVEVKRAMYHYGLR